MLNKHLNLLLKTTCTVSLTSMFFLSQDINNQLIKKKLNASDPTER